MKPFPLLLGVSIAANVVLLIVVLRGPASSSEPALGPGATAASEHNAVVEFGGNIPSDDTADRAGTGGGPSTWAQLSGGELTTLVARLRAQGFPPNAIRAIVYARVKGQFDARMKELMAAVEERPYWLTGRSYYNDPKVLAAQRAIHEEQARLMKDLLGADAFEENEISRFHRRRQFGDIPLDKVESMRRVISDYGEMRSEILGRANGLILPEDREALTFIEKSLREDVSEILSPEELESYELRSSNAASLLRSQLLTFRPTEAEFRALFQAAKVVEEKFGSGVGAQSREQLTQRQAAMNELAKQALAPERYTAFEQATDPNYAMLNRIVARYEIPATVVPQVHAVQQEIQRRSAQLRTLPAAERAAQASALAQEATARVAPLLGPAAFEAYKVYGGQWIESLTRGPAGESATRPPAGATKG